MGLFVKMRGLLKKERSAPQFGDVDTLVISSSSLCNPKTKSSFFFFFFSINAFSHSLSSFFFCQSFSQFRLGNNKYRNVSCCGTPIHCLPQVFLCLFIFSLCLTSCYHAVSSNSFLIFYFFNNSSRESQKGFCSVLRHVKPTLQADF